MIPSLDHQTGFLPTGRYQCAPADVEAAFATSDHRRGLWSEWQGLTSLLQQATPVIGAWLAGSFLSTKDEPDDIDCVYLIDVERAQVHPGSQAEKLLSVVSNNQTRDVLRLRIDSFVIPWRPFHGQPSPEAAAYLKQRGYWDDFWGRTRAADDSPQELRLSSTPRRGYLEVMIDGY